MAKGSAKQRLEYIMTLNAKEWNTVQAEMQKRANETAEAYNKMKTRIADIKEALKTATDPSQIAALHAELGKLTSDIGAAKTEMETWKNVVQEMPQCVDKVTAAMNRMASGGTLSMKQYQEAIKAAQKQLANFGNSRNAGKQGYSTEEQQRLITFISQAKEQIAVLESGWQKAEQLIKNAGASSVEEGKRVLNSLTQMRAVTKDNATIVIDGQTVNKIQAIDEAINRTNADMEKLKVNSSDYNRLLEIGEHAMANQGNVTRSSIGGSINDLQRLKASAQAALNTIDRGTAKGAEEYNKLQSAIRALDAEIERSVIPANRFNAIIGQLGEGGKASASIFELQQVIKVLESEMKHLTSDTEAFNKQALLLRNAKARMQELTAATKNQVNALDNAISRLKTYVMVYMGFQAMLMRVRSFFSDTLALSDTLSDIQKRTRLTDDAIKDISKTLDEFDTRTSQSALHELAATAGLLGLKSKQDIVGFTSAADKMSVALVELGSEGAAQLMKIATLTGDVAHYGTEQALNKTASAINELTAASAASAGPMVNFISRMGAVGSQANLTMGDLAGIGATLDALGQPIELSATAMNRFIMALKGNTDGLATTLDIPLETLENLMETGKTMEAIILVLQKMGESEKGVAGLSAVFDEMGSEGVRLKQTISSLVGNVDFLRTQVNLSNKAFDEGVSVLNEYNMKNNNAAAIMERTGNMLHEYFVNAEGAETMKGFAQALYSMVKALIQALPAIGGLVRAWISYKAALILTTAQQSKFLTALSATFVGNVFKVGISALTLGMAKLTAQTKYANYAASELNASLRAMSLTNPWTAILTVAGTVASYMWSFGEATSEAAEELEGANHAARDFAKAQEALANTEFTDKDTQDELVMLKHLITNYKLAAEGTDEWKRARAELQERYGAQLQNIAEEIKTLRNLGDNYEDIIEYINKTDDAAQKRTLIDNLKECEENSIAAQRALEKLSDTDERYEEQLKLTKQALDMETEARNLAIEACEADTNAIANNITMLNSATQAERLLRREIIQTAQARIKQASIEKEYKAIQDVIDEFMTKAEKEATEGSGFFEKLWYGTSGGKTVAKNQWNAMSNDLRNYMMGGEMTKELKNFVSQFKETQVTIGSVASGLWGFLQSGGQAQSFTNSFNNVEFWLENARKSIQERVTSIEELSNWDFGDNMSKAGKGKGESWMATGWDEEAFKKEAREQLDRRSELLHAEWNKYANGSDMTNFNIYTGQNFQDTDGKTAYENARDWVEKQTKAMKKVAKGYGWTLAGNWVWPSEEKGRGGKKKGHQEVTDMNNMLKGMIAELERYYDERKRIEEQNRADGIIDEVEKNRRLQQIEIEHQLAARDLRMDFVASESKTFDNLDLDLVEKIYGDPNKTREENIKNITGDLNKLRALLKQFGQTTMSEITHKAAENYLAATKIQADQAESMRKQLMEYDTIAQMFDKIRVDANESQLLMLNWGDDDTQYQSVMLQRMTVLFDLMKDAYNMDATQMETFMREHGFGEWAEAIFQDDVKTELFVNKIRDYYDKWLDTVKKETERLKKRLDFEVNSMTDESGMTLAQRQQARMLNAERQKEADEALNQIPYLKDRGRLFGWNAGTNEADNAELEILRLKIELEQELMDKEEERFNAEMEQAKARLDLAIAQGASEADLANARAHIEALQLSHNKLQAESLDKLRAAQANYQNELVRQYATAVQRMQPYADAVVQFSESFGEGVFGSKEDRQKAAWELLRSVTNTTLELLKQEAIRVATKSIYQKMELANTQAVLAQENAARTAAIIQQLGVEKAAALGLLTMEQAKSTANAFGKSFWVGLAVSAAIAAAFAGLQGLINGAINKAQSDISASSSGGRMATGMLAYAEGRYPVMGQDGKVYDARYESNLRTGVYRGGAHFAIFSEENPEMVLSGHTTRAVLNEPLIANAIMTLDKYGRLPKDFFTRYKMQTHADGTLKDFDIPSMAPEASDDERMAMMYERVADALSRIDERLSHPIEAKINMYGPNGLDESIARRDRYNTRNARR